MKLCRFELVTEPASPRSGFVFQGKVYETDGENPVGIYEPDSIRLLAPMTRPPSIRFFEGETFSYLNPASLIGPNDPVVAPPTGEVFCHPVLVWAVVSPARRVLPDIADEIILGLSLGMVFSSEGTDARSRDLGIAIGPAFTTPDEFDDSVTEGPAGRVYHFRFENTSRPDLVLHAEWPNSEKTLASITSFASESCTLLPGDIFAVALPDMEVSLGRNELSKLSCDRIGVLVNPIV